MGFPPTVGKTLEKLFLREKRKRKVPPHRPSSEERAAHEEMTKLVMRGAVFLGNKWKNENPAGRSCYQVIFRCKEKVIVVRSPVPFDLHTHEKKK